ncbi:MAG: hypothetical protein LUC93_03215 [Planctomycetaceae bacterium]|nr:hypothetical protein [Planctomycetaceae bacterium]
MPNISAWHNDASVCFLSHVLDPADSIPKRFYLSPLACAGILRRAAERRKTLPEPLRQALATVAEQERLQA